MASSCYDFKVRYEPIKTEESNGYYLPSITYTNCSEDAYPQVHESFGLDTYRIDIAPGNYNII